MDYKSTPLYAVLDAEQQRFVDLYAKYEDSRLAAQMAFDLKEKAACTTMSLKMQSIPAIHKLMSMIDGEYMPTKNDYVQELWKFIKNNDSTAKVQACQLGAELQGYITKNGGSNAPTDLTKQLEEADKAFRKQKDT